MGTFVEDVDPESRARPDEFPDMPDDPESETLRRRKAQSRENRGFSRFLGTDLGGNHEGHPVEHAREALDSHGDEHRNRHP